MKWFEESSSGFEEWYDKNKVDDSKFKEEKRVCLLLFFAW